MSILEIYDNLLSDQERVKKQIDMIEATESEPDENIKNYYSYLLDSLASINSQIESIEAIEDMVVTKEIDENSKNEK